MLSVLGTCCPRLLRWRRTETWGWPGRGELRSESLSGIVTLITWTMVTQTPASAEESISPCAKTMKTMRSGILRLSDWVLYLQSTGPHRFSPRIILPTAVVEILQQVWEQTLISCLMRDKNPEYLFFWSVCVNKLVWLVTAECPGLFAGLWQLALVVSRSDNCDQVCISQSDSSPDMHWPMWGRGAALQESADNNNPRPGVKLGLTRCDDVRPVTKQWGVTQTYDSLEDSDNRSLSLVTCLLMYL